MIRSPLAIATAAAMAAIGGAAFSAPRVSDTLFVPLFEQTCLTGEIRVAAQKAALDSNKDWTPARVPRFDLTNLAVTPTMRSQYDFKRPTNISGWKRQIDGREVVAIVAELSGTAKHGYHGLCVLLVPEVENAFPYFDPMRAAMKRLRLGGQSTDLPHFAEFAGRLPDRRRAQAEIFTRSRVHPDDHMHLYIAYE